REWGRRGTGDGEFNQPGGIVLVGDGTLFVADQGNHRVQKFTREGKFLATWGEYGSKPGQFGGPEPAGSRFAGPHFLSTDGLGRLFATEGARGCPAQKDAPYPPRRQGLEIPYRRFLGSAPPSKRKPATATPPNWRGRSSSGSFAARPRTLLLTNGLERPST